MAKKPGSWGKLNKLTKNVTVASRKKGWIAAICALLYIVALVPSSYFAVAFLAKILSYGGIQTDGLLPDFESGDYFQVNFAKTELRDNTKTTPVFEMYELPPDPTTGHVAKTQVRATSLRLEYAYNVIFNNAPKKYIANNIFFKGKYGDDKEIQILNIYTDAQGTKPLGLADVQKNKLNLMENMLYLKIKYRGEDQSTLIWMPTLFIGIEGFLSNFLYFKAAETMNKDKANPTIWENQTKILGSQANNLMLNGNNNSLQLDDAVYAAYKTKFTAFYDENKGADKEFIGDYNPYSNFAISSVNPRDEILPNVFVDSVGYMFDMNRVIQSAQQNNKDFNKGLGSNEINIGGKYIPQLFIFLTNVLETSENRGMVLPKDLVPEDWKNWYELITPKRLDVTQPEQFYFMFLPKDETIQNIISNRLREQVKDVLNGKESLATAIKDLQRDVLTNPNDSKYKWVYDWNVLPFQSYGVIEKNDYTVVKRTIQENQNLVIDFNGNPAPGTEFVTIDQPSLHSITNLVHPGNPDAYTIDDPQKRNTLFTKYWSANLYGATTPLNQIDIDVRNIGPDQVTFETMLINQIIDSTWDFIQNIARTTGNKLNIINGVSKAQYRTTCTNEYQTTFTPVNNYHSSAGSFSEWFDLIRANNEKDYSQYTVLDIKLALQAVANIPKNLQTVTFRFNINYE
ncbi:hypothetical protein [Spiroplasma sp. SV19]|uniref:hypothetical protein n=1 Tax=Spiroplasma sp. SV19 TaxID=2570468 RepID=UPI0024B81D7A|nr:hypothetical protein [Spiroplasma sp. SV19]WHQ36811.1 hypothetical protein E7Y35_02760 [Spiroplasma sp. SV19]